MKNLNSFLGVLFLCLFLSPFSNHAALLTINEGPAQGGSEAATQASDACNEYQGVDEACLIHQAGLLAQASPMNSPSETPQAPDNSGEEEFNVQAFIEKWLRDKPQDRDTIEFVTDLLRLDPRQPLDKDTAMRIREELEKIKNGQESRKIKIAISGIQAIIRPGVTLGGLIDKIIALLPLFAGKLEELREKDPAKYAQIQALLALLGMIGDTALLEPDYQLPAPQDAGPATGTSTGPTTVPPASETNETGFTPEGIKALSGRSDLTTEQIEAALEKDANSANPTWKKGEDGRWYRITTSPQEREQSSTTPTSQGQVLAAAMDDPDGENAPKAEEGERGLAGLIAFASSEKEEEVDNRFSVVALPGEDHSNGGSTIALSVDVAAEYWTMENASSRPEDLKVASALAKGAVEEACEEHLTFENGKVTVTGNKEVIKNAVKQLTELSGEAAAVAFVVETTTKLAKGQSIASHIESACSSAASGSKEDVGNFCNSYLAAQTPARTEIAAEFINKVQSELEIPPCDRQSLI